MADLRVLSLGAGVQSTTLLLMAVRAERARLAEAVRAMVFTKLTLSEDKRVVRAEVWTHDRDQDGLVGRFAVLALLEGEA